MTIGLILLVSLATVVMGDITRTSPANGACLCFNGSSVRIRSSACGSIIGSANSGQCYKYSGAKTTCSMGQSYEFFRFDWGGRVGWTAGDFLDSAPASRCGSSPPSSGRLSNEYGCQVTDQGKRVHESTSPTSFDCKDTRCGNTCRGGQCVAYVKCRCARNGKSIPRTSCWRPGQKVVTGDGRCNSNIAPNTAIATFGSGGTYYGHAAVFIRCEGDYTILVYDQWCARSVDYSRYPSGHRYYNQYYTITSNCGDASPLTCRVQNPGQTDCPASVSGCKRNYLESLWDFQAEEEQQDNQLESSYD